MHRKKSWQSWSTMLITIPWIVGIIVMLGQSHSEMTVARRQQTTTGIITSYERSNHNQYRYGFSVNDTKYEGIGNTPSDSAVVGEQATVFYDPQNPSVSSLINFYERSDRSRSIVPIATIGVVGIAVVIAIARANARNRSITNEVHSSRHLS
jgi:hypothetical protein